MRAPAIWPKVLRWLPAIGWALVIFGFSSLPSDWLPSTTFDYMSIAHFTEYAVLAALLAFIVGWKRLGIPLALAVLLACSLYAASDEFHQSFVPGRNPDPVDWATDTAGAGVALATILVVRRCRA